MMTRENTCSRNWFKGRGTLVGLSFLSSLTLDLMISMWLVMI